MSIFLRVYDSKAQDPFNFALFKCYKFMKGRTKYSWDKLLLSWLVLWLNFIEPKVILSNVKQQCGPLPPGLNLIEIELFPFQVTHETKLFLLSKIIIRTGVRTLISPFSFFLVLTTSKKKWNWFRSFDSVSFQSLFFLRTAFFMPPSMPPFW